MLTWINQFDEKNVNWDSLNIFLHESVELNRIWTYLLFWLIRKELELWMDGDEFSY